MDLRKAFHSISSEKLIKNLKTINIKEKAVQLIESYLTNHPNLLK